MCGKYFNMEKLDESKYNSWNIQVKSVLVFQELWTIILDGVKLEEANELAVWKAMATK